MCVSWPFGSASNALTPPLSTNVTQNFLCARSEHNAARDSGSWGLPGKTTRGYVPPAPPGTVDTVASLCCAASWGHPPGQSVPSHPATGPCMSARPTSRAPAANAAPKHSMNSPSAATARSLASVSLSARTPASLGPRAHSCATNAVALSSSLSSISPAAVAAASTSFRSVDVETASASAHSCAPSTGFNSHICSRSGAMTRAITPRRTMALATSSASSATARQAVAYVLTRSASTLARVAAASASECVGVPSAAFAAATAASAAPFASFAAARTVPTAASSSASSSGPSAQSRSLSTTASSVSGYWKPVTESMARMSRRHAACSAGPFARSSRWLCPSFSSRSSSSCTSERMRPTG